MLTQTAHPNQGRCLNLTKQLMNKQLKCEPTLYCETGLFLEHFSAVILEQPVKVKL